MKFLAWLLDVFHTKMPEPEAFGWYHLLCLALVGGAIFLLCYHKRFWGERQLRWVLAVYAVVAFALELGKQFSWALDFDPATQSFLWSYDWPSAPFQLCTTPIYAIFIALCLKKDSPVRAALLAYIAYVTILGSISTMLMPDSCLVTDILVNIHTMWLHGGSLVVSVYLLVSGAVPLSRRALYRGHLAFLAFAGTALAMDLLVYNFVDLHGMSFNMFYISPYFISVLPVFSDIQKAAPYPVFLAAYIAAMLLGSLIVYTVALRGQGAATKLKMGKNAEPVKN